MTTEDVTCPECGVSLDEIPFAPCATHYDHDKAQRQLAHIRARARPLSERFADADTFEDLRDLLVEWAKSQE